MEGFTQPTKSEAEPPFVVAPPAVESLLNPAAPGSPWPEEIRANPALEAAAEKRRALVASLDEVYAAVPDPTVEIGRALARGLVSPEQLTRMYANLSDLLEVPENRRAALYLPLEVIPPVGWEPEESEELGAAAARFGGAYLARWHELLGFIDARANFTDGDILEHDFRNEDLPEVVKAAHLAPALISKGMLTVREFIGLARDNAGTELEASLADAAPMLLRDEELSPLERAEIDALVARVPARMPNPEIEPSPARQEWLNREKESRARRIEADALAAQILSGEASPESVAATAVGDRAGAVAVAAVGAALEQAAKANVARAQSLLEVYRPVLESLAESGSPEISDALEGTWSRIASLGVAEDFYLGDRELPKPMLDAGFSALRPRLEREVLAVEAALRAGAADPRLAESLLPTAIIHGSKIKGYGTTSSDVDVAVFLRPGTSRADAKAISAALAEHLGAAGVPGNPKQFWLEAAAGGLRVGEGPGYEAASENRTSILFGGAWVGDRETIDGLHEHLLAGYLRSKDEAKRRVWVEQMEREAVQYRLMHRGYARFFPPRGGLPAGAPKNLDPQSAFWDSGFRRLATKLFTKRTFLPKIG